jgi:hypothetical protein
MAEEKRTCVRALTLKASRHRTWLRNSKLRNEIARQVAALTERRNEITKERARLYEVQRKSGSAASPLNANELAARNVAKKLLNGSAPDGLVPPDNSSNITLDNQLAVEQRGIDLALKVLSDKDLEAHAVEAVQWSEANRTKWRELCRDVVLTAIRLDALGEAVRELIDSCPDVSAVTAASMPMGALIERRHLSDMLINELTNEALSTGIVSQSDVKKARAR